MASYNAELGMWRATGVPGYFGSKEEAEAAEASGVGSTGGLDDDDFTIAPEVGAGTPDRFVPPKDTRTSLQKAEDAYRNTNIGGATGAAASGVPNAGEDGTYTGPGGKVYTVVGQSPEQLAEYERRLGTVTSNGFVGGVESLNFEPPATPMPGSGTTSSGAATVDAEAAGAKDQFQDVQGANAAENDGLWAKAWSSLDNLAASDYEMSDEARGYQREGLQQQRELLERMLGFDPNQYASQFADQALARSVAQGRSQGGGYAAQQAGMFAAQEQMPALQAEGARLASSLENQRLSAAAGVAKTFGDLGTMTRGQDEGRAQFESNLGLSIANSVADLSKGQVQLNQQESAMFAEIWMDFAQLQSVYAGMSSQEQMAWWQNETARRGQDKTFQAIIENIKANGAISDKDLLSGLFSLGGGLISAGGGILAANAARPS